MKRFFISTPIYYVNAKPHLGHAYTTIVADALNRFHRQLGQDAFFLTGVDEHGDKIAEAAKAANLTPQEYADKISGLFKDLWPRLGIENDAFIRTTSPEHKARVRQALQKVYDQGDIYFGEYGGHYCFGCERFLTEKELVDGLCPDHKVKPEYIAEKNYFFRMSKYQNALLEHIRENPSFIRPKQYRNEVVALLESGALEDLCISRPKSRLTWGVELPFDENYVTYVWFDALMNYLSALGWPDGQNYLKYWPDAQHLVAKDILKPHAVFWPTMLMALGVPLYRNLNVHGYWLFRDAKMSKSLGNVVEPLQMAEKCGLAGMRYFLLREMVFGHDASYADETYAARFNADLANDLGNLFSRSLAMTHKYFGGKVPEIPAGALNDDDILLAELARISCEAFRQFALDAQFSRALESLWELVRALNKYIDSQAPWTLFKEGRLDRLAAVMATILNGMRLTARHLWPVMPEEAEKMAAQLGLPFDLAADRIDGAVTAASYYMIPAGTEVAAASNLFPRIEPQKAEQAQGKPAAKEAKKEKKAAKAPEAAPAHADGFVEFEDFARLDLRVGRVVSAEPHPDADRLLVVKLDIAEDEPRQVVAGIAEFFKPEELIGKQVTMVANLKPRKLRGLMSQGMILAVKQDDGMGLLTPTRDVNNGSKVS